MLHYLDMPPIENFPFIEQSFDSPTLYGLVVKIGNELNKTIKQVNDNTEFINNLDVNLDEINNKIDKLNEDFNNLLSEFDQFKIDINIDVNNKLENFYARVTSLLNDYQLYFNAELNSAVNALNQRIDDIEIGQIEVYNPTTGLVEPLEKVLNDIYDSVRYDALTCTEFEALDLTATDFDAVEITAYNFDNNGKSILTNLQ